MELTGMSEPTAHLSWHLWVSCLTSSSVSSSELKRPTNGPGKEVQAGVPSSRVHQEIQTHLMGPNRCLFIMGIESKVTSDLPR